MPFSWALVFEGFGHALLDSILYEATTNATLDVQR